MTRSALYALAAIGFLTFAAGLTYGADVEGFHTTWAAARRQAKAEDKPIYLHFTTTWCGWCRRIEQDTYKSKEGAKALEAFVPASLDCTNDATTEDRVNRTLFQRFGGTGYPYLVMVTEDGIVLNTVGGYVQPERFAAELAKADDLFKQWNAFQQWAETADKTGYEYYHRSMTVNVALDRTKHAAAAARKVRDLDPKNERGHAAEAALVLLRDAMTKPRTAERAKQVEALTAEIRRLDPTNAKGVLQHVLAIEVIGTLEKAAAAQDTEARHRLLDAAAEQVTHLQTVGDLPDQVQMLWAYIGQLNAVADRDAEARKAYQNAIAAAPNSPIAPRIKQLMGDGGE